VKLCIPIEEDRGLDSRVCGHFGSAPAFLIVDTETRHARAIVNQNQHHAHGMCQPLAALAGEVFDGLVVGGIGQGALMKLRAANIRVFMAMHATVAETITAMEGDGLRQVDDEHACGGHHAHGPTGCHGGH
jgi:predicted Fe-Mo cluster-binding NifX family protein